MLEELNYKKDNCNIQLCKNNKSDFYVVESKEDCTITLMRKDVFATKSYKKAINWIEQNAKNFETLSLKGYTNNKEI